MKIAVLILAHQSRHQLELLIHQLDHPNISVFLHLDQKADFGYPDIEGCFTPVYPQFVCSWGGYNVVKATFALLKQAYVAGADYFILISGQDFPLCSNPDLLEFFSQKSETSFIHLVRLEDVHLDPLVNALHFKNRFTLVHVPRRKANNLTERLWFSFLSRFRKLQKQHPFLQFAVPQGIVAGENWFNLCRTDVQKLLTAYKRAWWLRVRLSIGLSMEEVLPHTLLKYLFASANWENNSLRFTVWKEHTSSPEYLTVNDLEAALQSGELFARKFKDIEVIKELQNRIQNRSVTRFPN